MRWRIKLEEYDYEIKYISGKNNTVADALSRAVYQPEVSVLTRITIKRLHDIDPSISPVTTIQSTPTSGFQYAPTIEVSSDELESAKIIPTGIDKVLMKFYMNTTIHQLACIVVHLRQQIELKSCMNGSGWNLILRMHK